MKIAPCPSCGAPVEFRAAGSVVAVCDYCRSTLVRGDVTIENIGRMAELIEDASPIRRAAEGTYRGIKFAVVGRLQYSHAAGLWNEWHILFDDQRSGWLSESAGSYVLTFAAASGAAIAPFASIAVGDHLSLGGQRFEVLNKESALCVAGEGELPMRPVAGYEAPLIDLANERSFATIDFSDDPPQVYIGAPVQLADLAMSGLASDRSAGKARASNFNCLACAAPIALHAEGSMVAACGSCGAVIDVSSEKFALVSKARAKAQRYPTLIALGSRGTVRGTDCEMVGHMRRQVTVEGTPYAWSEYLLYGPKEGFLWLTEYQGHWNLVRTLNGVPDCRDVQNPRYLGRRYRHFQTATAQVIHVAGEFYWRVTVGERAEASDFVSPPYMLSKEQSGSEISWSMGEYLAPQEVRTAFKLDKPLPRPVGVFANQPSPQGGSLGRYLAVFAGFTLLAIVIQFGFVLMAQNREVQRETVSVDGLRPQVEWVSGEFELRGRDSNLVLHNDSNVSNNWIYLDMTLVDETSGRSWHAGREIGYYSGYDGDGSWSEGSQSDEVVFSGVPAGRYHIELAAETQPGQPSAVSSTLSVRRDVPSWLNLWLLLIALAVPPAIAWMRHAGFESRRWAESDHASSGDDDDDDD